MKIRRSLALLGALSLVLGACSDDDGGGGGSSPGAVSIETTAALEDVVQDLAAAFAEENPDVEVVVTAHEQDTKLISAADGGGDIVVAHDLLVEQAAAGALATETFGQDFFVILTVPGNPAGVQDLTAFAPSSGLRVAACAPETAFGNLAAARLNSAGVTPADGVVDNGCDVEAADRVAAGELDALLVLRTGGGVRDDIDVAIPGDNPAITLAYAVLTDEADTEAFAAFIESEAGIAIRTEAGYLP